MRRSFACFLVVLVCCLASHAQERVIDQEEYDKQILAAGGFRNKDKYRESKLTEASFGPVTSEIIEHDPPSGAMRVVVSKIEKGIALAPSEWIFLGRKVYVKRSGQKWIVEDRRSPVAGARPGSSVLSVEYRDLGIDPNSSEGMRVLSKTTYLQISISGEAADNVQILKSWIDNKGRLRKEEFTSTNSRIATGKLTMHYEIDPTIRIEVPRMP